MAYNESAKMATLKYKKKTYERINFDVKIGKRDEYREQAAKRGMSLQAYIISLIEKDMQQD